MKRKSLRIMTDDSSESGKALRSEDKESLFEDFVTNLSCDTHFPAGDGLIAPVGSDESLNSSPEQQVSSTVSGFIIMTD